MKTKEVRQWFRPHSCCLAHSRCIKKSGQCHAVSMKQKEVLYAYLLNAYLLLTKWRQWTTALSTKYDCTKNKSKKIVRLSRIPG